MKTNITLFTCIAFLISGMVKAQDLTTSHLVVTSKTGSVTSFDKSDKTIQGSPYIQDNYYPARITADSEQIFNVRYNAITDEMEINTEESTVQAINKNLPGITVTFLVDSKIYKSMSYLNEEGISVIGYLIPIINADSKVKLFIKESKKFTDSKPAKSSYQAAVPAKFISIDDVYYFNINDEMAKPLSNNKKEIASLFPKHEKNILNYIKSEKLNVKKKDDLIKLFTHINQLEK
ncbi:MAG: hypothetical protein ACSHXF_00990 [Aquaticitalea sp.]